MHTGDTVGHSHVKPDDQFACVPCMPLCALLQGCMMKMLLKTGPESHCIGGYRPGFQT